MLESERSPWSGPDAAWLCPDGRGSRAQGQVRTKGEQTGPGTCRWRLGWCDSTAREVGCPSATSCWRGPPKALGRNQLASPWSRMSSFGNRETVDFCCSVGVILFRQLQKINRPRTTPPRRPPAPAAQSYPPPNPGLCRYPPRLSVIRTVQLSSQTPRATVAVALGASHSSRVDAECSQVTRLCQELEPDQSILV